LSVAIIDSGGANISSVVHALRRLGAEPTFTSDADIIRTADRVILPGVGAAGAAMAHLRRAGLDTLIKGLNQPVLGICLGMQLLFEHSVEDDMDCLGVIPGNIQKMEPGTGVRIPHMGWNTTRMLMEDDLLRGLDKPSWFYFVHSYCAPSGPDTLAECVHGQRFAAIVRRDNFYGVQFHPERSAHSGARLLKNFLEAGE